MPDTSLGQHWLHDRLILEAIADCAAINSFDTVLEIGPGLGTLTSVLLSRAWQVIAVEFDAELARKLPSQFPGKQLTVHNEDILHFDTSSIPHVYKLVANVPYYITSKIVQKFSTCTNMPQIMVLLVQKEVAERIVASPGSMSLMSVSAQLYWDSSLGPRVDAKWFTPPPKVDSQVVILKKRIRPLVAESDQKRFFHVVRAGFSERRKKLRSSLSGGLHLPKDKVDTLLAEAGISNEARAQELSIEQWQKLMTAYDQV
jgi:16S rRNA (adenine1518-N6/adenine1519-N6)-dimethyltransferase